MRDREGETEGQGQIERERAKARPDHLITQKTPLHHAIIALVYDDMMRDQGPVDPALSPQRCHDNTATHTRPVEMGT